MSDEMHYDPRAVRHAYEAILDDYTSKFVDELTTNAFDRSVIDDAVATVPAGGCVVDMGCGPGQVSAYLAGGSLLSTALAEFRRVLRTGGTAVIGTHAGCGDEAVEQDRGGSTETVVITYYEPEELADAVTRHGCGLAALRQRPPLDHEHQVTKLYITAVAVD